MKTKELIQKEWSAYENLISSEKLEQLISRPCEYMAQELRAVIPSIELATDGPVIQSVFLFTDDYLCEARLAENAENFEIGLRKTVLNYRFELGSHELKSPEPQPAEGAEQTKEARVIQPRIYQTAKVFFYHGLSLSTSIHYVGDGRESWIRAVRAIMPVEILK